MDNSKKISKAGRKFKAIVQNMQGLGLTASDVPKLQEMRIQYKLKLEVFPIFSVMFWSTLVLLLWILNSWGIITSAWYFYQDWSYGLANDYKVCTYRFADLLTCILLRAGLLKKVKK